jgi:fumarate reductase subunit D
MCGTILSALIGFSNSRLSQLVAVQRLQYNILHLKHLLHHRLHDTRDYLATPWMNASAGSLSY